MWSIARAQTGLNRTMDGTISVHLSSLNFSDTPFTNVWERGNGMSHNKAHGCLIYFELQVMQYISVGQLNNYLASTNTTTKS